MKTAEVLLPGMRKMLFLSFLFLGGVFFSQIQNVIADSCPGTCQSACSGSETVVDETNCNGVCCVSNPSASTCTELDNDSVSTGRTGSCIDVNAECTTIAGPKSSPCGGTTFCCITSGGIGSVTGTSAGAGAGAGSGSSGTGTCPTNFVMKSGVCFPAPTSTGLSDVSVFDLITRVLNWLLGILGVLGVLAFVISGTQYLVSAGDEDLAKTAKRNMTYAIIGLVVALAGLIIVNAIAGLTGAG